MKKTHCELCNSEKTLTKHHLIPRAVRTKKRFINLFGKEEMRQRGIQVCKHCHSGIHDIIPDEKELAISFNTKELLLADHRIQKHIEWSRKQK
jgi:alkyl hydroperoxide reductase subunit AhpF